MGVSTGEALLSRLVQPWPYQFWEGYMVLLGFWPTDVAATDRKHHLKAVPLSPETHHDPRATQQFDGFAHPRCIFTSQLMMVGQGRNMIDQTVADRETMGGHKQFEWYCSEWASGSNLLGAIITHSDESLMMKGTRNNAEKWTFCPCQTSEVSQLRLLAMPKLNLINMYVTYDP